MARDRLDQFKRGGQQPPEQRPPAASASQSPLPEARREEAVPKVQADDVLEPPREFNISGQEIYKAFRPSPRREEHLEIRLASSAWHIPRFFDLIEIIPNQRKGTEIVLLFPNYGVFITGKNLLSVIYVLKAHRCAFIEEYHSEKFPPVEDENAPFISSIELRPRGNEKGSNDN